MMKRLLSLPPEPAKAMWWVGTIFLVLGLINLSRLDGTPGQFALVFIVQFMAWGAARNYRIRELEQQVEQREDDGER